MDKERLLIQADEDGQCPHFISDCYCGLADGIVPESETTPSMTPERLAEILDEIDLRYLSQEYSSSNLAKELLKVCEIKEKK